jgi:hypothetical protein
VSATVTVRGAIDRLRDFDRQGLRKATTSAFYRALSVGRERALAALRRTQLGKMVERRGNVQLQLGLKSRSKRWKSSSALAGLKESTIPLIVRRSEVTPGHAGIGLRGGLETMGFAALIESGGRTKSHQIKRIRLGGYSRGRTTRAKQVAALPPMTFQVGGRWISKRVVTHPGSRVPRNPFLATGASAAERALPGEFETAVAEAVQKVGL